MKSDIQQADTSVTQDFDYKELAVDSYGYLPNDRRHSLKLFGNYQFNDEWSAGGNLLVQSGRPINCLWACSTRTTAGCTDTARRSSVAVPPRPVASTVPPSRCRAAPPVACLDQYRRRQCRLHAQVGERPDVQDRRVQPVRQPEGDLGDRSG
ncbi:hypothetical protein H1235_01560 [Pseudoxanthomonas sp. NC8]|nr:hypothetical protein H1235_01560 [Pseudoxanthomonas sp. NC8]